MVVLFFRDLKCRYSPNNGWDEKHFARRKAWDEKVRTFVREQKEAGVQIMWVGDLVSLLSYEAPFDTLDSSEQYV